MDEILSIVETYPELDLGDRAGDTDYIDFIKMDEVHDVIMHGTDKYNRKFFVIKFLVKTPEGETTLMQTFHQRYTPPSPTWVGCGHATPLVINPQSLASWHVDMLLRVLQGERVRVMLPCDTEFSYVELPGNQGMFNNQGMFSRLQYMRGLLG